MYRYFAFQIKYVGLVTNKELNIIKKWVNAYHETIPYVIELKKTLVPASYRPLTKPEKFEFYYALMQVPDHFYEFPKFQRYMSHDSFNKFQYNRLIKFLDSHRWEYVDFEKFKKSLYNGILKKKDFARLKHTINRPIPNFYTFSKILEMITRCSLTEAEELLLENRETYKSLMKTKKRQPKKLMCRLLKYELFILLTDYLFLFKPFYWQLMDNDSDWFDEEEDLYFYITENRQQIKTNYILYNKWYLTNIFKNFFKSFLEKLTKKFNIYSITLQNLLKPLISSTLLFKINLLFKFQKLNTNIIEYSGLYLNNNSPTTFNYLYLFFTNQLLQKHTDYNIPFKNFFFYKNNAYKPYYEKDEMNYIFLADKILPEQTRFVYILGDDCWETEFLKNMDYKYFFKSYSLYKHIREYIALSEKFPSSVRISAFSWTTTWESLNEVNLVFEECELAVFSRFLTYFYNLRDLFYYDNFNINTDLSIYYTDDLIVDTLHIKPKLFYLNSFSIFKERKLLLYTFLYISFLRLLHYIYVKFKFFAINNYIYLTFKIKSFYLILGMIFVYVYYFKLNKRILSWKKYHKDDLYFLDLDEEIKQKHFLENLYKTKPRSRKK